jgi:hypothetical protein
MNGYLLDTSALRGLSNSDLQLLVDQGVNLYASPYSVLELISHLEDSEGFDRLKGRVMKCRYTEILDDPQATFWNALSFTDRQRLLANDIVKASFDVLHAANSLEEFTHHIFETGRVMFVSFPNMRLGQRKFYTITRRVI